MSCKRENLFIRAVHKLLPKGLHREKMHNPYRGGTADVWYSGTADDLWAEYKYIEKVPVRAPIDIRRELSALQLLWLNQRHAEGRNVIVVLGTPLGAWIYANGAWNGKDLPTAADLRHSALDKQGVADCIAHRTMLDEPSKNSRRSSTRDGVDI